MLMSVTSHGRWAQPTISTVQPEQTIRQLDSNSTHPVNMKTESTRLMTYRRWPARVGVTPENLTRAGFYYTGSNDTVQCSFCENTIGNWKPGDNPVLEHKRRFRDCKFILGEYVGNVTMEPVEMTRAKVHFTAYLMFIHLHIKCTQNSGRSKSKFF